MQWNLKKLWPIIATSMLLATSFTYADINDCATHNLENCLCCLKTNETFNPPGMPLRKNGWDLQVSADALLWQLQEDALVYAIESVTFTLPLGNDRIKQKYNWGLRIGLDYTLPHDNWDVDFSWTHLISSSQGNTTAAQGNALRKSGLVLSSVLVGFTTASANYHNRLERLSLNTGREFFVSKWVTLRPFFGLRSDWLLQRLRASYSGVIADPTINQTSNRKVKWWGIGIESGLNTQWSFCGGFSLYGNVAGAIEYGSIKQIVNEFGTVAYSFVDSYHICRPILDLQLGLGWDYNFCDFHFGLKLGWENHVYLHQSFLYNPGLFISASSGDLTYQGWTLHANLDF
ncbi:Legionella pneumophila major outer membrane protein precursor [Candidatus Rhabdochlamydia oedothoracis]|uniref:Legionella pneumophila major outer membrane protein n=1 Tax=Candidatus Rhabdochlamydia oedothoracis TaxID=2720720 RepID=A0ABX8UZ20_9BACT|nr:MULTISPECIES: Lpg1974 family pore-forming outer membrane protein [Rhabdochlamydia]KAG6559211.1 hypothetical protein RHOW815_000798 [Candidatus Rhabdochlamydia sp. W815]QYF48213.1 Legionella pneumophila major outer membrane protein precursor [Candidatus Rhabdochlamydia oedothoracis]